jgi:general secretion pathway protein F
MPDYSWRAADAGGHMQEGRISARSSAAALKQLRDRGLTPLRIDDLLMGRSANDVGPSRNGLGLSSSRGAARKAKGAVNAVDVLAITSELAIMLRAGLALDNALRVLVDMTSKPSVAALVQEILDGVKGGTPLSRTLGTHRELFSDFYINMIRSGEASGQMSAVMDRLVEHMERQRALRENVVSATIYPAILLVVAVLSLVAMLGFVVPQFEKLFTDMGDALPLPTRLVMGLGKGFTQYGLLIALIVGVFVALVARWLKTPPGRFWWESRLLRLPLVGGLVLKYQLTLFSRSLGILIGNGVPLLTALQIATETVGNAVLRQALQQVAPIVKEGGKVVHAIAATDAFEPLAVNLIRVGEETGRIGPMMLELSNILNRDVEIGIKRLLTLVEPVLILVLGMLIAAIIVSILLGILSINDLAA